MGGQSRVRNLVQQNTNKMKKFFAPIVQLVSQAYADDDTPAVAPGAAVPAAPIIPAAAASLPVNSAPGADIPKQSEEKQQGKAKVAHSNDRKRKVLPGLQN